ncbi:MULTISPECIES: hypothetical protein [Pseudomonas]|uniref:Metallo-beta-lactamase domain-containing protein n=1 Tax=Pseudomonas wuhanensis TaxID=2954098 RepID=A0ABY9GUH6_9PSED|nr:MULTISPECIES: hypothetical protein [unclassified Pseudomonas]WLI13447.1 hypothetical protein PSH65_04615 [Pseudomonas sp. FP603]WLI19334.1 hypothetical protein PSH88_04615 [Pseudomonas sp. FP607]
METRLDQIFHPVGHGTFLTGRAHSRDGQSSFTWAYDCGSKRPNRIKAAIDGLASGQWGRHWAQGKDINLFVLSHFDDDHVNGVEKFLTTWTIRWLALPFTDLAQKLAVAAGLTGESCSSSTALFQLYPSHWLAVRGLAERVETILEVEGGIAKDLPNDPERGGSRQDLNPPRDAGGPFEEHTPRREARRDLEQNWATDLGSQIVPLSMGPLSKDAGPLVAKLNHSRPFRVINTNLEFMFYNSDQPDVCRSLPTGERVARRSGATMSAVDSEIQDIVKRYRVGLPNHKPKPHWRDKLRSIYDKHFGQSAKARNNISLCLLTRMIRPCDYFCPLCAVHGTRHPQPHVATLLLGDLKVDSLTIQSMAKHFGSQRWRRLSVVQVPHHGSALSWKPGNARLLQAATYVQCVPDTSPYHPHKDVVADIGARRIKRADYRSGLLLSYHRCRFLIYDI